MRIGVDVHEIDQTRTALATWGDRYRDRLFTESEIAVSGGRGSSVARSAVPLAERFAVKEAALKALRVGDVLPGWREIELVSTAGAHELRLTGAAATLAVRRGLSQFSVSLSSTDSMALAVVVMT